MALRCQPVLTTTQPKYLFALYRLAGILAPKRFKTLYAIYSFVLKVLVIILLPVMLFFGYVLRSSELGIHELLPSMQVFFGTYACEVKFVAIIYLQQYLFKIEAILEKLDARIQNSEEIREVGKIVRFGNLTCVTFIISYYVFSTSIFIGVVFTRKPPFLLYIPYLNWRESTFNLAISTAIAFVLLNVAILHQLINDTYAIIYTGILKSHLKMLIMRVMRIGTDPSCTQDDNLAELIRCLNDHKNIIELINTLGVLVSKTYFIQFLSTTSCLVVMLININIANEKAAIIGSVLYALCLIIQILPICYIANDLAAEGDRLPEAIFHMQWMDQSQKFQRLCLFFMHRSQQRIVFYAGKMFTISLSTFVSIIKFSFSVYTLLSTINFAERFN